MWSSGGESGQSDSPAWPAAPHGGGGPWSGGGASNHPTWPTPTPGGGSNPGSGGWGSPSPAPAPAPTPAPAQQRSMRVPYTETLRNGVHDKLLITITGTIESNANMFTVDLCKGSDIALHFNPRFTGKQMVVTNSCIGGKWGQEVQELQRFPFVRGQPFKLEIRCTSSEYKVAVNGSHLLSFKHRLSDLRSITSIGIYKDVKLTSVDMKTEN